jgi:hypothetical protein
MSDMVQIRSVKHYFNEFIVEGLKGKTNIQEIDLIGIKQKILTAFRNEVFGQIRFKYGDKVTDMSMDDISNLDGIHNILEQTFRKWRRLCMLCSEHGLGNFFQLEDLKNILEDQSTVQVPDPEEVDVTDEVKDDPVVIVNEETLEPVNNTEESTDDISDTEESGSL